MRNDPPSSLRRGHGYHEARAAGLGGIRPDRSPRQVNRIISERKRTRNAVEELRQLATDPEWEEFIRHRAAEGWAAEYIAEEAYWIKRYARAREAGYSLAFRLRYWPYSN